jgi:hypothetical protein
VRGSREVVRASEGENPQPFQCGKPSEELSLSRILENKNEFINLRHLCPKGLGTRLTAVIEEL